MAKKEITPAYRKKIYGLCAAIGVLTVIFCIVVLAGGLGSSPSEPVETPPAYEVADLPAMYREFKANELRAKDLYSGNRYEVTAFVNGIESSGLINVGGGATLTVQITVDNILVFFLAEFDKEQEEALKTINVGDTITFLGTCADSMNFRDCELMGE